MFVVIFVMGVDEGVTPSRGTGSGLLGQSIFGSGWFCGRQPRAGTADAARAFWCLFYILHDDGCDEACACLVGEFWVCFSVTDCLGGQFCVSLLGVETLERLYTVFSYSVSDWRSLVSKSEV